MATAAARVEPVDYLEKTESTKRAETVADLMTPAVGVFSPTATVAHATEALREATRSAFITYLYVVDPNQHLMGLVVMREMLLADPETKLSEIMIKNPFTLQRVMPLRAAL